MKRINFENIHFMICESSKLKVLTNKQLLLYQRKK